jgi:excinuclease ABC subunit A
VQQGANPALFIRDPALSLRAGAIAAWPNLTDGSPFLPFAEAIARHGGFSLDTPFAGLTPPQQRAVLHGTGEAWLSLNKRDGQAPVRVQYKGLFPAVAEAARLSPSFRQRLEHLVGEVPCSTCHGSRLRADAASVRFENRTIGQLGDRPLGESLRLFRELKLPAAQQQVAGEVLREIRNRLQFLVDVGLDYLTLSRSAPTLSGGEAQRIRLASQIGSGLTGVLYVLDEPTIGLHPRDNQRLLKALQNLRDLGNTMILVEHDREVIAAADCLLDFGPGAGDRGGEVVAQGPPAKVMKSKASLTGQYLSGKKAIPVPTNRRMKFTTEGAEGAEGRGGKQKYSSSAPSAPSAVNPSSWLTVKGARQHNLKNIDVRFPLGSFIAVTGVSGSGKSSLVHEILHNTLARRLHRARTVAAAHDEIVGLEHVDKVISVDQDPIGSTPSSNPATYTGVFDLIRVLFSQLPEAKVRGYHPRRFSFNKPGGRCEACEGNGQKKIEMHFLPDVWVECDVCHGARYNPETLAVKYKGKSISDVLNLRVSEALELFGNIPKIRVVLQTLADVGLDYIALGQAAPTLSGGEAQRVKLAAELARPQTGRTLYILDEPTTGLHFDDIRKLLDVLNRLVDLGNTVIVVEHNLDVIKTADWIIDLGPEAGDAGGRIVAEGTPEDVVAQAEAARESGGLRSHTGEMLAPVLAAGPHARRPVYDPEAALREREGDIDLDKVGADAKLPWETDGRRWHTAERVTAKGQPIRWDGAILTWLDERIHDLGSFGPTNWNSRTIVEIPAPVKSHGWFFHAHTGLEWLIRLVFHVGKNTFKQADLVRALGLKPLDQMHDIPVYGREERVQVANRKGPWQEVAILALRLSEIQTPAFEAFLRKAVESFHANVKRMQLKPEDVMPWKLQGERWHLGEKGFPPGKKVRWDRALLPRVLALVKEIEPAVEVQWDARDAVTLRIPGAGKAWGRLRTKDPDCLDCRFLGKTGQLNLSRVEGLGDHPTLTADRADGGTVLRLCFRTEDHLQPTRLKALLAEHLRGFREAFRRATA